MLFALFALKTVSFPSCFLNWRLRRYFAKLHAQEITNKQIDIFLLDSTNGGHLFGLMVERSILFYTEIHILIENLRKDEGLKQWLRELQENNLLCLLINCWPILAVPLSCNQSYVLGLSERRRFEKHSTSYGSFFLPLFALLFPFLASACNIRI